MGKPGFPIPLSVRAPVAPSSGWKMEKPGFPISLPDRRLRGVKKWSIFERHVVCQ